MNYAFPRRPDGSIDLEAALRKRLTPEHRPAAVAAALLFLAEVEYPAPLFSTESAAIALAYALHVAARPVV